MLTDEQSWEEGAQLFYDEIMPCVEVAERLGVWLLIEPEPQLLIETFEQYLDFSARVGSPWIGLNFDIGHAFCVGQDPEVWVERMAAHTRHYHLEDIASTRIHKHLIPGHGAIDFARTLAAIQRTGYDGWLTVELYPYIDGPDAAAQEARLYLSNVTAAAWHFRRPGKVPWVRRGRSGPSRMRAYLQLFRIPNVFTAIADVTMGLLFVRRSLEPYDAWIALIAASALLYTAGMVLNDVYDMEIDAQERPERPLPSGRIRRDVGRSAGLCIPGSRSGRGRRWPDIWRVHPCGWLGAAAWWAARWR